MNFSIRETESLRGLTSSGGRGSGHFTLGRRAITSRCRAQASHGIVGRKASRAPAPFSKACNRNSQRDGTAGTPSTFCARVRITSRAPSSVTKSCAA
jgi:hypothetical protein